MTLEAVKRSAAIFVATLAIGPLGGSAQTAQAQVEREVPVEQLVRDLGDERFPVRVRATRELWRRGDEAEDRLRDALGSGSPEVVIRARELLRKIELGILPDSPPAVVRLVESYDGASPEEKLRIVRRLKALRAWRQVLKIDELEEDPQTRLLLAGVVEDVAVAAAREELVGDAPDPARARQYLEMARAEPRQLMSLADFHRAQGSLDQELQRAAPLAGEAGHRWRHALHTAAGNFVEAAREADAAGMTMAAARLRLLGGDPLPWVRHAPVPEGQIPPASIDAYRDAVAGLWAGRQPSPRLTGALVEGVKHELDDESWHSLNVLYALGLGTEADRCFTRLSPVHAFRMFDATERIGAALEALGLDPDEPDFGPAIDRDFKRYLEHPGDCEEEAGRLFALASFLESRGLEQVLLDHYVAPLERLGREDEERFIGTLGELFSPGMRFPAPTAAIPAAASFAGDDPVRWRTVLATMFGEIDATDSVWESLADFRPDMSSRRRLELLAALFGRMPDRSGLAPEWWAWMEERAAGAKEIDRRADYSTLLVLAVMNTDARRFLSIADKVRAAGQELGELSDIYRLAEFEPVCLAAVDRWDALVDQRRKVVARAPEQPWSQANLAGTLRRVGQDREAEEIDRLVDRLALGDTYAMCRIGQAYADAGEFGRARDWWRRAAAQSVADDAAFLTACFLLYEEAKSSGDWPLAASIGEVYLLQQVMTGELMAGESQDSLLLVARTRAEVETARALSRLADDREAAISALRRCRKQSIGDGSMADYFFPAMRALGLTKLHDQWFEDHRVRYQQVIERFPGSHNTMNTAAWTASRANRRLDEAEAWVKRALELQPRQAAYLDTYAEVWFARGDREKAVEWSDRALVRDPTDDGLLRQHDRFVRGSFPLK